MLTLGVFKYNSYYKTYCSGAIQFVGGGNFMSNFCPSLKNLFGLNF